MMTSKHFATFGFIFGTLGLFVMSLLALALPPLEWVSGPFMAPGRFVSERLMGSEGTDFEVAVLVLFNGLLYAGAFWAAVKIGEFAGRNLRFRK